MSPRVPRVRRRSAMRLAARLLALGAVLVVVLAPALAFAAENLVRSYEAPGFWTEGTNNDTRLSLSGEYGSIDDWGGTADVSVSLKTPKHPITGQAEENYFSSFEDFAERSGGSVTLYTSADQVAVQVDYVWTGATKTTLGGLEAWSNVGVYKGYDTRNWFQTEYQYWIPTDGESGVYVSAGGFIAGDETDANFNAMSNDLESILASLRFNVSGAGAGAAAPGDGDGTSSAWRTVTGGIAAAAAAAVALAGAAASTRAKTGAEEPAPDQAVGYVLQLSTGRLTVSAEHSAALTARAFRVLPDGRMEPASDATLTLSAPAGVGVQPPSAQGSLTATVWQTGEIALGSALTIEARAALGTTTASVPVAAAGISRIVTRLEPAGTTALSTQGGHSATLVAAVELLGADAAEGAVDPQAVRATIAFDEDSEWLDISAPADYEDGRAVTLVASQPDPTSVRQPPESVTVRVTAQIGERPLTELVAIPLAGLPELDAKPDRVTLAADSGAGAEIALTVTNGGDVPLQFDTAWREGSRAIASADVSPTGPAAATLTLTESGAENLDPLRPQTASTLVVTATADGYDEVRRHIEVVVTQEGLFVDRANVDPSTGAFALAADGSARPTAIDLRVFVRDPATGEIGPDIGLAQSATIEIGGQEGTSGYAGLRAGGLRVEPAGVRQANVPSATFEVSLERTLPTAGEPVPAALLASVPGNDAERFSAAVPLRLMGVNMEPFSPAWETERDNCLDIIRNFVPFEHQDRLYALVSERSLTMGAEGLFLMRTQIWSFAHDQIMIEKHEHLDAAWWNQQIEDTLDWISWCGDIALGVASGAYVGVVGSIAIGMLKPLLVSAMEVWLAGGGLDDWLVAQTSSLTGVLEGAVTDPDFLAKLGGDKKAIGYALFIAYYFAKELYNDPNLSVTNAMKNVGRQLRDEGLVMFLRMIANKRGITPATAKAGAATPDAPRAKAAGGPAPDAPRAKTPPAPGAASPDAAAPRPTPGTPPADTHARPKPDAETARPTPESTPRVDAEADATKATPDADARKPAERTADTDAKAPGPDAKPAADAPAEQAPRKPAPENVAEKPAEAPPKSPADAPDPRRSAPEPKQRAKAIADDIAAKTKGGVELDPATTERIMRDPDAMRELRKNDPAAWKKFHEARSKTYAAHDADLKKWIEENVPEAAGKDVTIESFGTPDGVDRDYRAGYKVTGPDGTTQFIELKKEKWAAKSAEIFAEKTGGPTDPQGAAKWAKDHQQLATDQYHAEASVDMADQATVYNEKTRTWERRQVTPQAELVKQGKGTLLDPDGYGKTYETKVIEAYAEGNVLDAYKQADKAVHSLEGVQDGYARQGYGVKELPPKLKEGIQAIKDVESGKLTPAEADAKLKRLGNSGGLPDFMEKISGQFAGLKWARKA